MEIKKGIPVSAGIAMGEALVLDREDYRISKRTIEKDKKSVQNEKGRYQDAIKKASQELKEIEKSTKNMEEISIIFMGHRAILEDQEIQKQVINAIQNTYFTAEYALTQVMSKYYSQLKALHNEFHTRTLYDLEDIEKRLLRHLVGNKDENLKNLRHPVILVAKTLTPSETAILPQDKTLAFVTDTGGRTSHTAIVARTRGIPAVVGLGNITSQISTGDFLIVDGQQGIVIIHPDEPSSLEYAKLQDRMKLHQKELKNVIDLPVETVDGYPIQILANIEDSSGVCMAMENGAHGIGLYRTEFLYVDNPDPDEEYHYESYKNAVEHLGNHKLVIRTLDIGADKDFGIREFHEEKNPFLGCRSIRLCLENVDIFKKQLRAILRASALGNVEIMFPMISSLEEVRQAKEILEEMKQELKRENISYNPDIKVGIMIEIPSAALISDLLAKEVDFFSIGTNDLVQYTLAVDRVNERVAHLYRPAHPAIFRLIQRVVNTAIENHIGVCICGEMSAEFIYLIPLIGLGLREFSMAPGIIPECKEFIRRLTMYRAREITNKVLSFQTHQETVEYLVKEARSLQ